MIHVGYANKVKLLTAGITLAASNTRRLMLSRDRSKVMSEIVACRGFLDELERMDMAQTPDIPTRWIDDSDPRQALLEVEGFYDETGPRDKPAADDSPT